MKIVNIKENKKQHMDLLLEADPEKEVVEKYIEEGQMYAIIEDEMVVCEAVITKYDKETYELKNIATLEQYRSNGYAKEIIKYIFKEYRDKCKRIIVRTTQNMIPFYVLNGFNTYHHTVKNFFIDNYKKEIWDGNLQCIDLYYYSKNFDKTEYKIISVDEKTREKVNKILEKEWEETKIISRGKIIDGTKLDGFIAIKDTKIIGLITYIIENDECEIVSLNSFIENNGIGSKLIDKVKRCAKENNCKHLVLITTNNNVRAIEFYQKRGFEFSNIYINAIENSRKLKPRIPLYDDNGLPIKDEIEFKIKL